MGPIRRRSLRGELAESPASPTEVRVSAASSSVASSVGFTSVVVCVAVAPPAVPTAPTGKGGSAVRKTLMSDDTKETVTAEAAEAAFAASPPVASPSIRREGCVASVPAVDGGGETPVSDDRRETAAPEAASAAAPSVASVFTLEEGGVATASMADVAAAAVSPATRRRMHERKEDMCSAVGGTVVIGTGSVRNSTLTSAVEVAIAVAPAVVSTVAPREGEAVRIVAAEATGIVVLSAASEGILGKWGVELPPAPVSR